MAEALEARFGDSSPRMLLYFAFGHENLVWSLLDLAAASCIEIPGASSFLQDGSFQKSGA